jgi:antitoxin component YwqK of YwqJK toxin-antitoxin module
VDRKLEWKTNKFLLMKKDINSRNKQGQRHGYRECYYSNGQLMFKGNYINGKQDGCWKNYHLNGQLFYKVSYINGKRNGFEEEYGVDGKLWSKGNRINEKRSGWWIFFNYKQIKFYL